MCSPAHLRDSRCRRLMVIGNLSLIAALLFWYFARSSGVAARWWVDGLSGLLFGISIGANLVALRCGRKCGIAEPEEL